MSILFQKIFAEKSGKKCVSILFQKIFGEKSGKKCVSILYQKILTEQEVKFPKKWRKCVSILYQKIFYEVINGKKCVSILYQKILGRNRCMKCVRIFCQYKSRPKSVVKNACVFLPTIRLTRQMSLIVCRKYSRILYQNLSTEKRGTKCVSIFYQP